MGDKTSIEWTDATWNPVSGCSKVSKGCKYCYAERLFSRPYHGRDFTDVRTHPDRLNQPLRWRKPRRIFVNSMSDLFHEKVSSTFLDEVFVTMYAAGRHTFQILTKRPRRAFEYLSSPTAFGRRVVLPNVWLGVSIENQETADERVPILLDIAAAVRFVSYEPALGPVDFTRLGPVLYPFDALNSDNNGCLSLPTLNWIIAGGESGPHARPSHPAWFRSIRDQCQDAGVPFFFKQQGEWTWAQVDKRSRPTHVMCEHGYYERDGLCFHCIEGSCGKPGRIVQPIAKVGKKRAGRLLDGREWNEFPA